MLIHSVCVYMYVFMVVSLSLSLFLELRFLSFGLEIDEGAQQMKQKLIFIAMSVAEKAQWIADIAQVSTYLSVVD